MQNNLKYLKLLAYGRFLNGRDAFRVACMLFFGCDSRFFLTKTLCRWIFTITVQVDTVDLRITTIIMMVPPVYQIIDGYQYII